MNGWEQFMHLGLAWQVIKYCRTQVLHATNSHLKQVTAVRAALLRAHAQITQAILLCGYI